MLSNKVIYLTEHITDSKAYCKEHNQYLFTYFDIPNNLQEAFDIIWCEDIERLEYICPHCFTRIRTEWILPTYVMLNKGFKNKYNEKILNKIKTGFEDYLAAAYGELSNIFKLKNCPICNAKLIKDSPYVSHNTDTNSFPARIKPATRWLSKCCESKSNYYRRKTYDYPTDLSEIDGILLSEMSKKTDDYLHICDVSSQYKLINVDVNADFLKKYLMHLLNLESNILSMSQRLTQLYVMRSENDGAIAFDLKSPLLDNIKNKEKEIQYKVFLLNAAKAELQVLIDSPIMYEKTKKPSLPKEPIMQKSNIFNRKRIEAQNSQALQEYEQAMKKYKETMADNKKEDKKRKELAEREKNTRITEYNEIIPLYEAEIEANQNELKILKKQKSNLPTHSMGIKQIIDSEIALVEESLKNTYKGRNNLYSYNIVFEKYRNIVALSTFYEYLMAGRCVSLEGINGAYNIYESEIRLDTIITQLDEINTKLDDIKQNQYMIYQTLCSIASSVKALSSSMEQATRSLQSIDTKATTTNEYLKNILNNSDVIAHNSVVSAYYAKKNAELTNALGFMVALG